MTMRTILLTKTNLFHQPLFPNRPPRLLRRAAPRNPFSSGYSDYERRSTTASKRDDKVVNINTTTQVQVVLCKPERFETAAEIADHLREKRTVVMNLEQTHKDTARRLIDFLSGVAYAQDGKIKKVANSTYIITPFNVGHYGRSFGRAGKQRSLFLTGIGLKTNSLIVSLAFFCRKI